MNDHPRIGYCLKVFPRFSQTFVLNELLAHQAAGEHVEIFSINRPNDGRFHSLLCQLQSSVNYLDSPCYEASEFWKRIGSAAESLPGLWEVLSNEADQMHSVICSAVDLALKAKTNQISHLHAHFGNVAAGVARLAAKLAGITYSFTAHARDIYRHNVDLDELEKKVRDAQFVATVSKYNIEHLTRTFPLFSSRFELVYNGMDLDRFGFESPTAREPLILAIGRLVEKKGFQYLIQACEVLKSQSKRFRCEFVGSGPLEGELRAEIARRDLNDCVYLTGPATTEEVAARIRDARVIAVPCVIADDGDRDGMPTVLLEAMALGTPCVSTDVTGIPEIIVNEQTGLIVKQRDAETLALACSRLLSDAHLRQSISLNARLVIDEQFNSHVNCRELRRLFRKAVSKKNERVPCEELIT